MNNLENIQFNYEGKLISINIEENPEDVVGGFWYVRDRKDVITLITKDYKAISYYIDQEFTYQILVDKDEYKEVNDDDITIINESKLFENGNEWLKEYDIALEIKASDMEDFKNKADKVGFDCDYDDIIEATHRNAVLENMLCCNHNYFGNKYQPSFDKYDKYFSESSSCIKKIFYNNEWHELSKNEIKNLADVIHHQLKLTLDISDHSKYLMERDLCSTNPIHILLKGE